MDGRDRGVCVFAPSPMLTLTIESGRGEQPAMHVHGGGQGVWVATMLCVLNTRTILCGPFGGETGQVLEKLLADEPMELRSVRTAGGNGCYVEDRLSGELTCVADVPPTVLDRHELDNLHNNVIAAAVECGLAILTGPADVSAVPPDTYRRVAADLAALDVPVVADLSGAPLTAALEGRLTALKVSDEDLVASGLADSEEIRDVVPAAEELADRVSAMVVLTRGASPALAWVDGRVLQVSAPSLTPLHHRGAGDSMTAGIAAALSRGLDHEDALRLGAAAGVVNVTRHGLATGQREMVDRIVERVDVDEWRPEAT